jgi:hypothetical protein
MSPTNATVRSLAERRVRRQKIFIAVGSVVLLAVLGFQLPKLLGGKGRPAAVAPVTTGSGAAAAAAAAATPAVPAGQLPGDRVVVQRDSNQLISFGLFKTKDPFIPQVTTTTANTPPIPPEEAPPPTTTPNEPTPPVVPVGTPVTPAPLSPSSPTPGTTTPSAPPAPPAVPTEALIATNGLCERVAVKGTFPVTENIFRLVSIAKDGKSVQVSIVGGSFDSGEPTATLKLGDKLTLVNTADGTRYVIELKAKCANVAQPGTAPTTPTTTSPQPTPTTPVAPAPAPASTTTTTDTVTTPIVTDSDDTTTTTTTTTSTPSS